MRLTRFVFLILVLFYIDIELSGNYFYSIFHAFSVLSSVEKLMATFTTLRPSDW